MTLTFFSRSIHVYMGDGLTHEVRTLERAREILVDPRWPKTTGKAYKRAVEHVLEAAGDLDSAADAFEAAAKDAGVLVSR